LKILELNKKNIKKILLIVCVSIAFFWGLNHSSVFFGLIGKFFSLISPFLLGLCIAFVVNVLLRLLENLWDKIPTESKKKKKKRMWLIKLKRPVCLTASVLLIIGVIFILLFMILPQIAKTVMSIVDMFPQYVETIESWWSMFSDFLASYSIVLPEIKLDFKTVAEKITAFIPSVIGKTVDFTGTLVSGIFNLFLGFAFSMYVLAQKEKLGRNLRKVFEALLPGEKTDRIFEIARLSNKTFTSFVTGQLTEALIIGLLCFVGMCIFGMPYALVISVLVGFTALIPVFGAFIGTAIGAFLILMVNPVKALWFVVFIVVLQQLEGNLIYPKVVGKSVGLPGIWVLSAVTVGGGLFGIVGMLLSVPTISILYTVLREKINKNLKEKNIQELEP